MTTAIKIEDVKRGDFFRRKPDAKKTFIKEGFCRFQKKYEGQNYWDISNFVYLKKGTIVYIDFEF